MSEYIIGLTGGVASGKSALAARFAQLGAFVCDADQAARETLATGTPGLAEVVAAFGPGVLDTAGALDRAAMRQRIFADAGARRVLEAIVHPRVRAAMLAACRNADAAYAIAVIPLLAESGRAAFPWLQRVLLVDVPLERQLTRLLGRDRIDERLARQMLAAQASREQRRALADDIVVNDGPLSALDAPVAELDRRYRWFAATAPRTPGP